MSVLVGEDRELGSVQMLHACMEREVPIASLRRSESDGQHLHGIVTPLPRCPLYVMDAVAKQAIRGPCKWQAAYSRQQLSSALQQCEDTCGLQGGRPVCFV